MQSHLQESLQITLLLDGETEAEREGPEAEAFWFPTRSSAGCSLWLAASWGWEDGPPPHRPGWAGLVPAVSPGLRRPRPHHRSNTELLQAEKLTRGGGTGRWPRVSGPWGSCLYGRCTLLEQGRLGLPRWGGAELGLVLLQKEPSLLLGNFCTGGFLALTPPCHGVQRALPGSPAVSHSGSQDQQWEAIGKAGSQAPPHASWSRSPSDS